MRMSKLNHLELIVIHPDEIILPRTSGIDCEAYREDIINRKGQKEKGLSEVNTKIQKYSLVKDFL